MITYSKYCSILSIINNKSKDILISNKAKIHEEAKKLNPIDDIMFRKMAEEPSFCEEILRVITNDESYNINKYPITSNIKKRYKQTEEGQSVMCEIMERITKEELDRVNKLNVILIKQGRTDDLLKSATDPDYQIQLLDELVPEEK